MSLEIKQLLILLSVVQKLSPKSCDLNARAYCGLVFKAMDLIIPEMSSFYQPFEDFTKITQKLVRFFVLFFQFSLLGILNSCHIMFDISYD